MRLSQLNETVVSKNVPAYYVKDEPKEFISVEYEVALNPSVLSLRAFRDKLLEKELIDPSLNNADAMLQRTSWYLHIAHEFGEPVLDGGGLEVNFPPMTLEAYTSLKTNIHNLIIELDELGFTAESEKCGIHLNIDYTLLGRTTNDKGQTVAKMAQFMYNNIDFMVEASLRKGGSQIRSDMYSFLNDTLGVKPKHVLDDDFFYHKGLLRDFFVNDPNSKYTRGEALFSTFNVTLGKEGREALEIRWFGSTTDISEFFFILEFGHAFVNFAKSFKYSDMYLATFQKYVLDKKTKYPHLESKINSYNVSKLKYGLTKNS